MKEGKREKGKKQVRKEGRHEMERFLFFYRSCLLAMAQFISSMPSPSHSQLTI